MVTFIANYISTTVPAQMRLNDANHALQVENQLGHLAAVLRALGLTSTTNGATVIQPLSLGSLGLAPFAGPDRARVTGVPVSSTSPGLTLGLLNTAYTPPTGIGPEPKLPGGCNNLTVLGAIIWNCPGNQVINGSFDNCWNVNPCQIYISTSGKPTIALNFPLNNTHIGLNLTSTASAPPLVVGIFGNNDSAYIAGTGGTSQNYVIIGNNNFVQVNATSSSTIHVLMVGSGDNVTVSLKNGAKNLVYVSGWGTNLNVTALKGGGNYTVNYTGFNPNTNLDGLCPQASLSNTDRVGGLAAVKANGTLTRNYSDVNAPSVVTIPPLNPTGLPVPPGFPSFLPWTQVFRDQIQYGCIFFATNTISSGATLIPASLVVDLYNSYAPYAEVAFDEAAVVYAQVGGVPVMVNPPPLTVGAGQAVVWAPTLTNPVPSQSGTGTAVLSFNERAQSHLVFPVAGWRVNPQTPLHLAYTTPYYIAWMNYFCGSSQFITSHTPGAKVNASFVVPTTNTTVRCGTSLNSFESIASNIVYRPGGPTYTVNLVLNVTSVVLSAAAFGISVTQ